MPKDHRRAFDRPSRAQRRSREPRAATLHLLARGAQDLAACGRRLFPGEGRTADVNSATCAACLKAAANLILARRPH